MRNKGVLLVLILLMVVGFAGCAGCSTYNTLVTQDEQVETAWANVQALYQRRADLIPNLVRTVEASADFERETLESVVQARARATSINLSADDLSDPEKVRQFEAAQAQLSGALSRLLVVSENYPQLRSTEGFQTLQAQLEGTENRITIGRRDYNEAVRQYNTAVRRFPASIIAGVTGFERRTPFEAAPGAEEAPVVDFNS